MNSKFKYTKCPNFIECMKHPYTLHDELLGIQTGNIKKLSSKIEIQAYIFDLIYYNDNNPEELTITFKGFWFMYVVEQEILAYQKDLGII